MLNYILNTTSIRKGNKHFQGNIYIGGETTIGSVFDFREFLIFSSFRFKFQLYFQFPIFNSSYISSFQFLLNK